MLFSDTARRHLTVTWLNLADTALGQEGIRHLASSPYLGKLHVLWLRDTPISDESVQVLAGSPALLEGLSLYVSRERVSERGQAVLKERFGEHVHF